MKLKILLFALASYCTIETAQAQIRKGAILLGGSIGFSNSKSDNEVSPDNKTTTLNISPAIGKAIKDNLMIGVGLSYNNIRETNNISFKEGKTSNYGGAIFIRRYVPIINRLYIIGEGLAAFSRYRSKTDWSNATSDASVKGWNAGLTFTPGISFAVNNKLHLETGFNNLLSIQYQKRKYGSSGFGYPTKSKSFSAGVNLENSSTFYLGFRILINGKA